MVGKTLRTFGARLNWYRSPDSVFGLYDGYFVTISQRVLFGVPKEESIRIDTAVMAAEVQAALQIELDAAEIPIRFARASVAEGAIILTYRKLFTYHDRHEVADVLDQLIGIARSLGVGTHLPPAPAGGFHFCLLDGTGVVLDSSQYTRLRGREHLAEGLVLEDDRSYLRGLTGAAIFGLGGLLIVVFKAYVFEPFPSLGGAVIGFLCVRGYRNFDGHLGSHTRKALLSLVVSVTLLGCVSGLAANAYSGGMEPKLLIDSLLDHGALGRDLLRDIFVATLFATLVCYVMLRWTRRRNGVGVTDAVAL